MSDPALDKLPTDADIDPTEGETVIAENIRFELYLKRYDGLQTEWLMGKVIQLMSNNARHQIILLILSQVLNLFLAYRERNAQVILAGLPMYLGDDKPARQPDLMVVLDKNRDRIKDTYLDGAADIVVEIVSPESGARDRGIKFTEYESAGVGEYWLFDPQREEAAVYALDDDGSYKRLPRDDGYITSKLLPGFRLQAALLWQEDPPNGAELVTLVQAMIGSTS